MWGKKSSGQVNTVAENTMSYLLDCNEGCKRKDTVFTPRNRAFESHQCVSFSKWKFPPTSANLISFQSIKEHRKLSLDKWISLKRSMANLPSTSIRQAVVTIRDITEKQGGGLSCGIARPTRPTLKHAPWQESPGSWSILKVSVLWTEHRLPALRNATN